MQQALRSNQEQANVPSHPALIEPIHQCRYCSAPAPFVVRWRWLEDEPDTRRQTRSCQRCLVNFHNCAIVTAVAEMR